MKKGLFKQFICLNIIASLSLFLPLSTLTVYAQIDPDELPNSSDESDFEGSGEDIELLNQESSNPSDLGDIPRANDLEAPLSRSFITNNDHDLVYTPGEGFPDDIDSYALTLVIDEHNSFETAYDNDVVIFLNKREVIDKIENQSFIPDESVSQDDNSRTYAYVPREDAQKLENINNDESNNISSSLEEDLTAEVLTKYLPNFYTINSDLQERLNPLTTYERRLVFEHSRDLVAITGENNGDCLNWNASEDNEFINGARDKDQYCDPPRVDVRVILALDYLLKPRSDGGAGREYLKVERLTQFIEKGKEQQNRAEPILDDDGDGIYEQNEGEEYIDTNGNGKWDKSLETTRSPHFVDLTSRDFSTQKINGQDVPIKFNEGSHAVSQAIDISEIDRIRVTTRIRKTGIFSSSNSYKFQKPINIKVAWQSDDGIAAEPLPELAIHEMLQDLSFNSIFELLDAEEILGEFNFDGRTLDSLSTEDLAKFVGGQLLGTLLDGQDISQFNFGDTIKDFGAIVLGGALNVDPEAIRNANSLADIEEYTGRQFVAKQIGLDRLPEGDSPNDLLTNIGKQRLADLLGIKSYALNNYDSVNGFKEHLGWGYIEERLPVPERSFASNDINEVKAAIGEARYNTVFAAQNAIIIDERLRLPANTTLRFINSGNVAEFKQAAGQKVWDANLGRYHVESANAAEDYTPASPLFIVQQLTNRENEGGAGQSGSLFILKKYLQDAGQGDIANSVVQIAERLKAKAYQAENPGPTYDPLEGMITYNPSNKDARTSFLSNAASEISSLETLTGTIEGLIASLNVPGNGSIITANNLTQEEQKKIALYNASLNILNDSLQTLHDYRDYGQNPDGTSQQRDRVFGFPAGTMFDIIGGSNAESAFKIAGVWYLSETLPSHDQKEFRTSVTNVSGDTNFVASNPKDNFYADVFLSDKPAHEFRRIGRRLLIEKVQDSPEYEQLEDTELASDIFFYVNRYQKIYDSLRIIERRVSDFPDGVQGQVQNIINNSKRTIAGVVELGDNLTNLESSYTVRDVKDDLFSIIDFVEDSDSFDSVNQILGAASDIERAVMEIMEGDSVAYSSHIPSEISLESLNTNVGSLEDVPLNPLRILFGSDKLLISSAQGALAGGNIDNILVHLGIQKLADTLDLPKEALYLFYEGDQTADNLFFAVGSSRNDGGETDRQSLIEKGREHITARTISSLAQKLGVKIPDWLTADDIADFILGDPVKTLVGVGGRKLEQTLELPSDFFNSVIYPDGNTDAERDENRQQAIISATLGKLGIELDLPKGFTLTDNPVESMGQARIEKILGLQTGEFKGTREEMLKGSGSMNDLEKRDWQKKIMAAFSIPVPDEAKAITKKMNDIETEMYEMTTSMRLSYLEAREIFVESEGADRGIFYLLDDYFALAHQYDGLINSSIDAAFGGSLSNNYYEIRLNGIDRRLGILDEENNGPTRKWIEGKISTAQLVSMAGEQGATEFGGEAFAAILQRLGVEDPIFDGLISNSSNRNFLIDFFKQSEYDSASLARVYKIMSEAFSFNIDKSLGFEAGTMADLIAKPKQADEILFDQGVRLLAGRAFGINMSDTNTNDYDRSINAKRVMQRVLFGALYNRDSGHFELAGVNPTAAMVGALSEFRDIAGQYIQQQIGGEVWPFFQVPINAVMAIADLNIEALSTKDSYVSFASTANRSITEAREDGVDVDGEINRVRNVLQTSSHAPALTEEEGLANEVEQLVLQAVAAGAELSLDNKRTDTENELQQNFEGGDAETANENVVEEPDSEVAQTNNDASYDTADERLDQATLDSIKAAVQTDSSRAAATKSTQMVAQTSWDYIGKEFGYASMDFGLSKLLDQKGLVAPGLSRILFEGTPEERTNAIAYISSNVLAKQFRSDLDSQGLGWLTEQQTIKATIEMIQGNSANINELLTEQGLVRLSGFEDDLFGSALFKDLGLVDGTLAGVFGFALNGNDQSFSISGVGVKGLSELYDTNWLLGRAFYFGEQILGIQAGKLAHAYQLSYNFYKTYDSYSQAVKLKQSAEQIAMLKTQMVNAAIELGIYVVDLIFGKEIAKIETAIGLPPGTITGALSLVLTALIIGTGPMFFVSLAIFVLVTIFGFGKTRITTKATADGYYPFVGKVGEFSPPFDPSTGNVPYTQWPAAETLNDIGKLKGTYFGEFDPTNEVQKLHGFKEAARGKVINLVTDLFMGEERGAEYYTSDFYPTQVLIHRINESADDANKVQGIETSVQNHDLYQEDSQYADQIYALNLRYRSGACNSNATGDPKNYGICTSPDFWDVIHIAW